MRKALRQIHHTLYYRNRLSGCVVYGKSYWMRGGCAELTGDCTYLAGDCTGVYGNCTGVYGNIDTCRLTRKDRKKGVRINSLLRSARFTKRVSTRCQ
jgi:hypothetical protein